MYHFYTRILFIIGIFIGIYLAVLLKRPNNQTDKTERIKQPPARTTSTKLLFNRLNYDKWFNLVNRRKHELLFDTLRYHDHQHYYLESNFLADSIPVLCVILVRSERNARAARNTWAKNCAHINLVPLHVPDRNKPRMPIKRKKEDSSWILLCKMLNALDSTIDNQWQWLVIVYDYTFVILENVRMFVVHLDADNRYYLGDAVKFWGTVYNQGSAGYLLSRGAVRRFQRMTKDACSTSQLTYYNLEDYYLGKHLSNLNITPVDTRDSNGLSTFHPHNLYHVFFPSSTNYNSKKPGIYPSKCCSPQSIAFNAIEADKMYTYYYLLYRLQIFTYGHLGNRPFESNLAPDHVWMEFVKSRNLSTNLTSEQYYKAWEDLIDDPTSFAQKMKLDYDDVIDGT